MDGPIRRALAGLIEELNRPSQPVKWVAPENIHLTLKFLGEVAEERVSEAAQIVRDCAVGIGPFALAVRGTGAFPNVQRPRVIFAGAQDERDAAHELARRLEERMEALGVEREERPFQCHVTLGRLREPRALPALAAKMTTAAARDFGKMTVAQVTLIESKLTPQGPIYRPVEQVLL
jgi:RNA 2',3'-cyclic 3'-phosphodiesterase